MPEHDAKAHLIERFGRFYHSDYVALNQPWIRKIPFHDWMNRQLIARGYDPEPPIRKQPDKPMPQLPWRARLEACRRLAELTLITDPASRACDMYWRQFNRMAMRFESQKETRTG